MSIPFHRPDISQAEIDAVTECLQSGWLTSGRKVKEFEDKFAAYVGAKHAIAVNSATSAALLLLDVQNIGPGDEVIVPSYTFSGPAMMARKLGARVVFADCAPGSHQIDPNEVAAKITDRTKVVMPTHFAGAAADIQKLNRICAAKGVYIIEDAAHAFPTTERWGQKLVGACSDGSLAAFFSFYATKTLATGDGGMITTNDEFLAGRLRQFRMHGMSVPVSDRYTRVGASWQYDIAFDGWKMNMTDIAAAMGIAQLHRADEMHQLRLAIAQQYEEELQGFIGLRLPEIDVDHAAHLYVIRVDRKRDEFIRLMAEQGVQCSVHFIPLHMHTAWAPYAPVYDLPNASAMYHQSISLPIYPSMTPADVSTVCEAVKFALKETKLCFAV
ncbi:DegT/DnrJ/EryC1/StrS aminotransferase family protein [Hyphomicrobium sp. ghe19]|uniref:DegT/DnrJ/EryC1/StrS family aminotransferase n=1 Tax=Hyphomicrobium sp. ghe19 TaxID=2682968 RepID=UPI0013674AE6|nr:UDP-4-amino-4-deoxy-L-arabinose--oxoglutarate aminotransferase [Hyphomicrobium sp. ghe19]